MLNKANPRQLGQEQSKEDPTKIFLNGDYQQLYFHFHVIGEFIFNLFVEFV